MKVLVLGGRGFLGSWVVRELLQRNDEVAVLLRNQSRDVAIFPQGVRQVVGDCSDIRVLVNTMRRCDAVIHAAAYYPVYSTRRRFQAQQALRELRSVLAAARAAEITKFVFTSSPMVLVRDPDVLRRCTYHSVKCLLHDEFLRWVDGGIPGMMVIPGACFGPDDRKPTTGRVILEIARRRLRFIVEGRMNAVDVRDVARAQVDLLHRDRVGSCYELGNWNCLFSRFAAMVSNVCDVPVPSVHLPYGPLKIIARLDEWIQYALGFPRPLLPESGLDQIHFGAYLDSSPAKVDLGFRTRPIETTIRDTVDWFVVNGYLPVRTDAVRVARERFGQSS